MVKRARAFEMRIVAHDPYVTSQIAADLGVELVDLPALYAASDYITLHVALTPETQGMLSREAFAQMKTGVRIVNCARGELVDEAALAEAHRSPAKWPARRSTFSRPSRRRPSYPLFALEAVLATPHIGGSTEEAQEIVGVRIAEQVVEYLKNGVAINAVNMPALSPEQYRALGPYIELAERLGNFAAHIATGNPRARAAGLLRQDRRQQYQPAPQRRAGRRAEPLDAPQGEPRERHADRRRSAAGTWPSAHEAAAGHTDSVRIELETDHGVTAVEGAVLLGKPRLIQVDGIYCEAPLAGHLIFMKNQDVPGRHRPRRHRAGQQPDQHRQLLAGPPRCAAAPGEPLEAVAVVSTDELVPESVLAQLRENPAVRFARSVEFKS